MDFVMPQAMEMAEMSSATVRPQAMDAEAANDGNNSDDGDEEFVFIFAAFGYQDDYLDGGVTTDDLLGMQQRSFHMACCEVCQRLKASQASTSEGIKSCAEYRMLEDVYEDVYEDERISTRRSTSKCVRRWCNRCGPRKQAFRNRKRARGKVVRKLRNAERTRAGREARRSRGSNHHRAWSMPALKAIWRTSLTVAPKFNAEDWF